MGGKRKIHDRERRNALERLTRCLIAAETMEDLARGFAEVADSVFEWDAYLFAELLHEEDRFLRIYAVDTVEGRRRPLESPAEPYLTMKELHAGEPVLINRSHPSSDLKRFGATRESQSLMFAPMSDGETLHGIVSAQSYEPDRYGEDDLRFFQAMAAAAAPAMHRLASTRRRNIEQERYRAAIEQAGAVPYEKDYRTGVLTYMGRGIRTLTGYDPEEVTPDVWNSLLRQTVLYGEASGLPVDAAIKMSQSGEIKAWRADYRIVTRSGEERWLADSAVNLVDSEGRPYGSLGILQDVTERHHSAEELQRASFYDPLTNLPNRALFLDRLDRCLQRTQRNASYRFAVLFLDLDRFKMVNESFGHAVGDRILQEVGSRLQHAVRRADTVARLGDDEFAVLLEDCREGNHIVRIAERLLGLLSSPATVGDLEIYTGASMGISIGSSDYKATDELMRDADTALQHAKELGRGQYVLFDEAMRQAVLATMQVETGLRNALRNDEFRLHYQPIFSRGDRNLRGFEALVRWQHPTKGLLAPGQFIRVAEDSGIIIPLGRWVLKEACRQMVDWQQRFPRANDCFISVNLSAKQFASADIQGFILSTLEASGLQPPSLHLEITESAILQEPVSVTPILANWRSKGIRILLDDFGTGYSPLSNLTRFPVDFLKIDRSFVANMNINRESRHIVRSVISLAKILEKSVIAEGVETEEQFNELAEFDCDYIQGYLLGRPVAPEEAERFFGESPDGRPNRSVSKGK